MMKQLGCAILLLAPFASLSGCGDVAKCSNGTAGCINGRALSCMPNTDGCDASGRPLSGECKFDLVLDPVTLRCAKSAKSLGDGGVAPGAGIDYCAEWTSAERIEYDPTPHTCYAEVTAEPDSFAALCTALCEQDCLHARAFCGAACNLDDCTSDAWLANCNQLVDKQPSGVSATAIMRATLLQAACEKTGETDCASTACTGGTKATCGSDIHCTDACDYAQDGSCDDGDALSANSSLCAYGTDCSDCGPRARAAVTPKPLGGSCVTDPGCNGYNIDFKKAKAFCVVTYNNGPARCSPGCAKDGDCPADSSCEAIYSGDSPYTDANSYPARACFPLSCGG